MLYQAGMSLEKIAVSLNLDLEFVKNIINP